MTTTLTELFSSFMSGVGLRLAQQPGAHWGGGLTYELEPDMGAGNYWVYPLSESCVLSMCSLTLKTDLQYRQKHPPFLYIGLYEANPFPFTVSMPPANHLLGYVGDHEEYNMRLPTGASISSIGISMTVEYCGNALAACPVETAVRPRSDGVEDLARALERLDGSVVVPELTLAFQ